jgi:hypothetical protein
MQNAQVILGRPRVLVAGVIALLLVAVLTCLKYSQCVYAVAWHWSHGNDARVGVYRAKLPLLWRQSDAGGYDATSIIRAIPLNNQPQIVISPALPGAVPDSDQEELKSTQAVVSSENRYSRLRSPWSTVVLHPKPFTLYCVKEGDSTSVGTDVISHLQCHAAGVPYTFTYDGPPGHEKEAEVILSSLE